MELFRQAWTALLSWVPVPIRVALAIVLVVLIVSKITPRAIRGGGVVLDTAWRPLVELFTYPEYLLTSTSRRLGWRLPPGTFGYDRALGAVATGGTRLGQWMRSCFARYPRFPWKTTVGIVALVIACWYLAPEIPVGSPRNVLGHVNRDVVQVDAWLATGRWKAPTAYLTSGCVPTGSDADKHAGHKVHAHDKHHRKHHRSHRRRPAHG